jgi:ABC-type transport system involved in multi-copper enzyme maturation permease subunit
MTLLTYPVERLEIIMSKYLSNFFIIIILLYIPHVIDTMLVKLDILSIFYIFIALIPITIYTVSLSFLLGVITRNEVLTILGLYVIYSGINRIIGVFDSELGAKILNWYIMIFDLHSFSFGIEFLLGIMYWIVSPIFLAVISMIYFAYMEFD